MGQFPQLLEEDFNQFNLALNDLLAKSEASTVLIAEKAGYLIHECGDTKSCDTTQVATLGSNAFAATQFMASLMNEMNFTGMFQQGETVSTLMLNIDENCLLIIVFKAGLSVGAVKYYANETIKQVAQQLVIAAQRAPGQGLDLCDLNPDDVQMLFKRKEPGEAGGGTASDPAATAAPTAVAEPVVCQKAPFIETVFPGKYYWCACGRSKTQPFCDGSHKGTGLQPIEVELTETKQIAWCGCKHSGNKPYCDGTHSSLA
jgi:CDGSH-type Zn-finger protein/predicted regulator of Ras-like GTPase activity (Roadblock/LC7/MglB family)